MSEEKKNVRHYTPAGGVTQKASAHSEFICVCSDEGKADAEALMSEVEELMFDHLDPEERAKLTDLDTLDAIAMNLPWRFQASITGIHADQWYGVTAESESFETFIQCDQVIHGLAATYRAFHRHQQATEASSGE